MFAHKKDIINDWVKVGTMLIVSHVLGGGDVMDQNWQMTSLYTLLGFTAYQVVTRDLVSTSAAGAYKPIADDWVKVGTMMVVSRLLSGESLQDQAWQRASLYTLLGFTAYHLLTKRFVQGGAGAMGGAIDDAAKFGTMFVVSRLLAGGALDDRSWQMASLFTIVGFAAYHFATVHLETAVNAAL